MGWKRYCVFFLIDRRLLWLSSPRFRWRRCAPQCRLPQRRAPSPEWPCPPCTSGSPPWRTRTSSPTLSRSSYRRRLWPCAGRSTWHDLAPRFWETDRQTTHFRERQVRRERESQRRHTELCHFKKKEHTLRRAADKEIEIRRKMCGFKPSNAAFVFMMITISIYLLPIVEIDDLVE